MCARAIRVCRLGLSQASPASASRSTSCLSDSSSGAVSHQRSQEASTTRIHSPRRTYSSSSFRAERRSASDPNPPFNPQVSPGSAFPDSVPLSQSHSPQREKSDARSPESSRSRASRASGKASASTSGFTLPISSSKGPLSSSAKSREESTAFQKSQHSDSSDVESFAHKDAISLGAEANDAHMTMATPESSAPPADGQRSSHLIFPKKGIVQRELQSDALTEEQIQAELAKPLKMWTAEKPKPYQRRRAPSFQPVTPAGLRLRREMLAANSFYNRNVRKFAEKTERLRVPPQYRAYYNGAVAFAVGLTSVYLFVHMFHDIGSLSHASLPPEIA